MKSNQSGESEELRDKDNTTVSEIRERYKKHYGDIDDVEMSILLHVHDHSKCATGIWVQAELGDIADLIHQRELEARKDENEQWHNAIKHTTGFIGKSKFRKRIAQIDEQLSKQKGRS